MQLLYGCSLIIHTKNEQENIRECISSAEKVFNEVIVVDMQSNDNTLKIAKNLGARIYKFRDAGTADPARNFGISKAKYKWILSLDADERLPKTLAHVLKKIIKEDKYDLVKIPHKNIILGKWIKHTGWWPDYHFRLFKKGCLTYFNTIHTQPEVKGRQLTLSPVEANAILHKGIISVSQLLQKYDRYSSLENHFSKADRIRPEELLSYADAEFVSRYISSEGYKDGLHGFMLSKFRELYRYIEFAKYWERRGYKEIIDPKKLQELIFQKTEKKVIKRIYRKIKSQMNF